MKLRLSSHQCSGTLSLESIRVMNLKTILQGHYGSTGPGYAK